MAQSLHIGLDAGSVSVKLVVIDAEGTRKKGRYERHKGHPLALAYEMLDTTCRDEAPHQDISLSITGSAGRHIASALGIAFTNEVLSQAYATRRLYPHVSTIFELGGEDAKLIILEEGRIADFSMNSVCAAGTGSFLDQQAERLKLTIDEFSALALRSKKPSRIAGRCSVFAKSDMIHLQQIATPLEDIVAGLCFAVVRNFKGSIIRGRPFSQPVCFQGGVAANHGMVRAFREIFGFSEILVPDDFALMGALGAALRSLDEGIANPFDLDRLKKFISSAKFSGKGHAPLVSKGDDFFLRHPADSPAYSSPVKSPGSGAKTKAFLGIDIGSISTNLAVIDEKGTLLAKRYLMTAGRPIEAVNQGLREVGQEIGDSVEILGVGTTGSGRYMIADYVGADIVKNEITAQATAAAFIDRDVDTIFEIGGQDSKFISLRNGVVVDFEMNKACAAGTGSFLEEQAEKLDISVKHDFARSACSSDNPCRLGERCTVFMENSLMANLQKGAQQDDLLAGLAYSIVQNYITKVVGNKAIGNRIFFQGGVAFNKSVVAAFEKYLGRDIMIPPHHDVTGAIGMALIALRLGKDRTSFKGFDLSDRPYQISSFECRGCSNVCEINQIKIAGEEQQLFYGGRCEKYDVRKKAPVSELPDLFSFREKQLWKVQEEREAAAGQTAGTIGIPYVFYLHDYLPFWTALLWELGFRVEVSPKTTKTIAAAGCERVLADTCYPVKVAHGHITYLVERGISTLLIPSFVNTNTSTDEFDRGYACPLTQTIPYAARIAHPSVSVLSPVIARGMEQKSLISELWRTLKPLGIRKRQLQKAVPAALRAQSDFTAAVQSKGKEILSAPDNNTVVIFGRAYNAFDSGMNLNIPRKLADLGVLAVPMDMLPLGEIRIRDRWPNMYWRSGQKVLKAARYVKDHPQLHGIYIENFSCGPDSFIMKYFSSEMGSKPYLLLEIDEHSADAGAITRCEAFLDSIGNQGAVPEQEHVRKRLPKVAPVQLHQRKRTVYIPRMSDHAFAIAAAFEKCGVQAEVLPPSDKEAVDIGRRYVSGKECYPCTVTTGDMLRKTFSSGFSADRSAFFMPSGSGPCRFGQYNVFHKMVLSQAGFDDVPIFSPSQDDSFYETLGIVGSGFSSHAWKGVIAYEVLLKCLHETRPYEREQGSADTLYQEYLGKLYNSLRGVDGPLDTVLGGMQRDFGSIPKHDVHKPLIGIVGEIFVRSHTFSNEDIVRKIEALGGEAWLAPAEEWIYYVNRMAVRKALIKKEWSAIMKILLKDLVQKRIEHGITRNFRGFLRTLAEPSTAETLEKASPFLHDSFEGEAILSIGKSIDLVEKGASGIINAMPFGCMPGTVVTTLLRGVNKKYGIPCISVSYDGTESPMLEIQIEAFMSQASAYSTHKKPGARYIQK